MLNTNKHLDFFNPFEKLEGKQVHIIGVGALGSYTCVQLAKLGLESLHIWDFDTVEPHNLTNQAFNASHVNMAKVEAVTQMVKDINPEIKVRSHGKYTGKKLQGIVFLCVDSIEVRNEFYKANLHNTMLDLVIDERIALTSGQVYCTDWRNEDQKKSILDLSDFTHDEVEVETSACGTTLSVSPSVLLTISYGISAMINFLNGTNLKFSVNFDAFSFKTSAF